MKKRRLSPILLEFMLKPGYIVFQRGIMKKFLLLGLCTICSAVIPSCTSSGITETNQPKIERKIAGDVPDNVRKAVLNAPDDVIIGIGTANYSILYMAQSTAETRARVEIARQVNSLVTRMVYKHKVANDIDSEKTTEFEETITVQITRANLSGSTIIHREIDEDGAFWVVVSIKKENAAKEINEASPKITFPELAEFNNNEQFMATFWEICAEELQVGR
jgi:hypothetical protein